MHKHYIYIVYTLYIVIGDDVKDYSFPGGVTPSPPAGESLLFSLLVSRSCSPNWLSSSFNNSNCLLLCMCVCVCVRGCVQKFEADFCACTECHVQSFYLYFLNENCVNLINFSMHLIVDLFDYNNYHFTSIIMWNY